jgi:hypothetical protein
MVSLTTQLFRDWVDPDLTTSPDVPFSISLTLGVIPTIDLDLNALKKDLSWLWTKLTKKAEGDANILTVSECVKKAIAGELSVGQDICVSAIFPKVIPRRIVNQPTFDESGSRLQVFMGRGSAAYCPQVGRSFFSGLTCNFIYLAEADWDTAYFFRTYFPSTMVPLEHLRLLNNLGVVAYGILDRTAVPYSCLRTGEEQGKTVVDKFTGNTELALRVRALYHSMSEDVSSAVKEFSVSDKVESFIVREEGDFGTYWLKGA